MPSRQQVKQVLPFVLDLVLPTVAFYGLKQAGAGDYWALTGGALLTTVNAVFTTVRRRRLDSLGLLVILEILLALVLTVTLRDARLVLARPSFYLLLAGAWLLYKAFTPRPLTVEASRPMAVKGDPQRKIAYEWCVANVPEFLRVHRRVSVLWAAMIIAYAVVRVLIIYSVPDVGTSVWLNEVPGILALSVCLAAAGRAGKRLGAIVDERVAAAAPQPEVALAG